MLRYIGLSVLMCWFTLPAFTQEVSGIHNIQPGNELNAYDIKTTIKGLQGVDIARIKYFIDTDHIYNASPNNTLFSDRNENYVKFYIMAVPESGELNIELGIIVKDASSYDFQVEFQFSRNEEKQTILLPKINISGGEELLVTEEGLDPDLPPIDDVIDIVKEVSEPDVPEEDIIEPVFVVKETPEVETNLMLGKIQEEESEIIETPEPLALPVADEIPETESVAEETPEPVLVIEETPEFEPIVEEIPEPLVEEVSVIEETQPSAEVYRTTVKYTVQLLSLSKFSQSRLNTFCRQHKIAINMVKKNQVGDIMKITYGEANSIQEAYQIMEELKRNNNISDAFVTPL